MARTRFEEGLGAPSQRQLKVGEMLRRAVSDVLMRGDIHDPALDGVSVTVGEVRVSPDLRNATVFVMPLGGDDVDEVLEALRRSKGELRRMVARQVALKYAPDFTFKPDLSYDQMDETRRLLSEDRVRADVDGDYKFADPYGDDDEDSQEENK